MVVLYLISALIALAALLFTLFLIFTKPRLKTPDEMKKLAKVRYAHRGLFDESLGIPENTLKAFERAVENGFGIELDVHITRDGRIVVMHDNDISRMCGVSKLISKSDYDELKDIKIGITNENIPLFSHVLEKVGGKVPLIVEIKVDGDDYKLLCGKVLSMMSEYRAKTGGQYCLESFDPRAMAYIKKKSPDTQRGQLAADFKGNSTGKGRIISFCSRSLTVNILSRPDFVAYRFEGVNDIFAKIPLAFWKPHVFVWTVKSEEDMKKAEAKGYTVIFEGFIPNGSTK